MNLDSFKKAEDIIAMEKLLAENKRLKERMESICRDYCQWYDRGLHGMDGAALAYHLVGHARMGLNPDHDITDTDPTP